jgi:hypothetical protein
MTRREMLAQTAAAASMAALPGAAWAAGKPKEAAGKDAVLVLVDENAHRVDIGIDGKPFTSLLWETNQRKPVLYPLIAPDGTTVTRGYPFHLRPGERVDHPHHAGLWFNYGNANGFDFWNNSDAIKPADRAKYGTVRFDKLVSSKSGATGEVVTESTWIAGDAASGNTQPILTQMTRYVFGKAELAGQPAFSVDLIVTLTGLTEVTFHDDKEGLLGIRVAHFLESATEKGGVFMDANGKPTQVAAGDTAGATGVYRTSEDKVGDAAWGTRGAWCWDAGTSPEGKAEAIAILDHTGNPGYPAYWHARGYGLFAVNPLGAHIFDPKAPAMNFSIAKGASATFKYRVLVISGTPNVDEMKKQAAVFDREYR